MLIEMLMQKGGVVMAFLLFLSVYVAAVILYKICQFWWFRPHRLGFMHKVEKHLRNDQLGKAKAVLSSSSNPLAAVVLKAIDVTADKALSRDDKVSLVRLEFDKSMRPFYGHLRGLEMVANVGPLLGLLGTVIGMVKAFAGIGDVGSRVDPSVLAGGIWEALLTTVAGLSVAIPALVAHYLIDAHIDKIRDAAIDRLSRIMLCQ